jgi:lysophospholipase L1-like esterase
LNGVSVRIKSLGFRGEEVEIKKAPGVTRVAVAGDSVVFGQGVEESGTLPVQLAAALRAKDPARKWEVVNAGVRGYNTADYRVVLEQKVVPLDPDAVVVVITVINDPEREPFSPYSDKIARWERARWTKWPVADRLFAGAYADEVNRLFVEHVRAEYDPAGADWKGFVADLTAIRDLGRGQGTVLVAVIFPMLADDDMFAEQRRQLKDLLTDLGIAWVDLKPSLSRRPAAELVVGPADFHPNARALGVAAAMAADALLEALEKEQ